MSARCWCFTINNPEETQEQVSEKLQHARYAVFQKEVGEKDETTHWQGYVEFGKVKRLSACKKIFPRAHWEQRRGSRDQARDYCMKSDSRVAGPYEQGDWEIHPGKRNDIIAVRDAIRSGMSRRELIENFPNEIVHYPKGIQILYDMETPHREEPPEVHLLYGPSGCGKTRMAHDEATDLWSTPIGGHGWFDGYDGHEDALFDDFAGAASKWRLDDFLRLLDRYSLKVPIKGGFASWRPRRIWITTNIHPREWWDWSTREQQYPALVRRISNVVSWGTAGDCIVIPSNHHIPIREKFFHSYTEASTQAKAAPAIGAEWRRTWEWKYNWIIDHAKKYEDDRLEDDSLNEEGDVPFLLGESGDAERRPRHNGVQ